VASVHSQLIDAIRAALPHPLIATGASVAVRGVRGLHGEPDSLVVSEEPALVAIEVEQSFSALSGLEQLQRYLDAVREKPASHIWDQVCKAKAREGRPAFRPIRDLLCEKRLTRETVERWVRRAKGSGAPSAMRGIFAAGETKVTKGFVAKLQRMQNDGYPVVAVMIQSNAIVRIA
jgi:hypothetical protein